MCEYGLIDDTNSFIAITWYVSPSDEKSIIDIDKIKSNNRIAIMLNLNFIGEK
jgi:hypothetical protein